MDDSLFANGIDGKVSLLNVNIADIGVDGDWSSWSDWDQCSATCEEGNQGRRRECNNPEPRFGGEECLGSAKEIRSCVEIENCRKKVSFVIISTI